MKLKSVILILAVLVLSSCGNDILKGEYICDGGNKGIYIFNFKPDGHGSLSAKLGDKEISGGFNYQVNGEKITISGGGDSISFTFQNDELIPEASFSYCEKKQP